MKYSYSPLVPLNLQTNGNLEFLFKNDKNLQLSTTCSFLISNPESLAIANINALGTLKSISAYLVSVALALHAICINLYKSIAVLKEDTLILNSKSTFHCSRVRDTIFLLVGFTKKQSLNLVLLLMIFLPNKYKSVFSLLKV